MSVRDGLLAVLSLGPAYGLQLHAEFGARAPHRAGLNVGQVYSTLDRAELAGLVQSAGTTPDGLPLTRLTDAGQERAIGWMSAPVAGPPTWEEMLDQVLVTSTVAPHLVDGLISDYRRLWRETVTQAMKAACTKAAGTDEAVTDAAGLSTRALASAADGWLAAVGPNLSDGIPLPLSTVRPRRGRRPRPLARV